MKGVSVKTEREQSDSRGCIDGYFPSKVSEIVAIWRKDLGKVNPKAAESLADPEDFPNFFKIGKLCLLLLNLNCRNKGCLPSGRGLTRNPCWCWIVIILVH